MRKINVLKNQNIFDIAIQEYGNFSAVFKIIEDNPQLSGENIIPAGYVEDETAGFDLSLYITEGLELNITENYILERPELLPDINKVIS